jgi:hypothetical protein
MALLTQTAESLPLLSMNLYNANTTWPPAHVGADALALWVFENAIIDRSTNPIVATPIGAAGEGDGDGPSGTLPPQYIRGRVLDVDGLPAQRTVIAIDRSTGARQAITTSDATGYFTLRPRTLDPCILVAVPLDGEQLNALALDNITPVPD